MSRASRPSTPSLAPPKPLSWIKPKGQGTEQPKHKNVSKAAGKIVRGGSFDSGSALDAQSGYAGSVAGSSRSGFGRGTDSNNHLAQEPCGLGIGSRIAAFKTYSLVPRMGGPFK
eukprot:1434137-Amphidinium_carterae.1